MVKAWKPPADAKVNKAATSSVVEAWCSGYTAGMPEGHRKIAIDGYNTGMHEGMRYVIEMLGEGIGLHEAVRRCMGRVTDPAARIYWTERLASLDPKQPVAPIYGSVIGAAKVPCTHI